MQTYEDRIHFSSITFLLYFVCVEEQILESQQKWLYNNIKTRVCDLLVEFAVRMQSQIVIYWCALSPSSKLDEIADDRISKHLLLESLLFLLT